MYVMNKKGHILITLWEFEDKTFLNSMQIKCFWSKKILKEIQKGYCVQVPHTISV